MSDVRDSAVRIALLFPDLLGTYGDGGNALVLERRAAWRQLPAEIVEVPAGGTVPAGCDIYLLGGGEDAPQIQAARELGTDGPVHAGVRAGGVLLAVCAGLQIAGHHFPGTAGEPIEGLGLLPCDTVRPGAGVARAVGELLASPTAAPLGAGDPGIDPTVVGTLTGFENHGGCTRRHDGAAALATVEAGVGNGDGTEGVVAREGAGHVVGTYLHGPALARNPGLADQLLTWVTGSPLEPLTDADTEALRAERLDAARRGHLDGVAHRSWRDRLLRRN